MSGPENRQQRRAEAAARARAAKHRRKHERPFVMSRNPGPIERSALGYVEAVIGPAALLPPQQLTDVIAAFVAGAATFNGFLMNGLSEGEEVRPMDEALMAELQEEVEAIANRVMQAMGYEGGLNDEQL